MTMCEEVDFKMNLIEDDLFRSNSFKEIMRHPYEEHKTEDNKETVLRRQSLRRKFRDSYRGELGEDLDDAGTFAYSTLVAASLCNLYEYSDADRRFIDHTMKTLVEYLGVSKQVRESAKMVVRGDGAETCEPFADLLQEQKIVKNHGSKVILYHLLILSIKDGVYDARSRSLLRYISMYLNVDWNEVDDYEDYLVDMFTDEDHEMTEEEMQEKEAKDKKRKWKKFAMIGGATIGGGLLIGLTGGLGILIGGSVLASTAGAAVMGSIFGAAGAKLAHYKMKKRVGDVEEFVFEPLGEEDRSMHITLAVTGWVTKEQPDFTIPWLGLDDSKEQYSLKYESKYMIEVGTSINYLKSLAIRMGVLQVLKRTLLEGIWQSIKLPLAFVSLSNIIDNPWSVATNRTVGVGKQLAEVLLSRQQGKRPVTLIGFTFGARVIYHCLQELATRKNNEGIIEDAVMLGTPVTADPSEWAKMKSVVAGRIVNGFCRGDWLLKTVYRTASLQTTVAGLQPVEWNDRRMVNIDLTEIVTDHQDYKDNVDSILDIAGLRTKPYKKPTQTALSLEQLVSMNKKLKTVSSIKSGTPIEMSENIENEKFEFIKDNQNMDHRKEFDVNAVRSVVWTKKGTQVNEKIDKSESEKQFQSDSKLKPQRSQIRYENIYLDTKVEFDESLDKCDANSFGSVPFDPVIKELNKRLNVDNKIQRYEKMCSTDTSDNISKSDKHTPLSNPEVSPTQKRSSLTRSKPVEPSQKPADEGHRLFSKSPLNSLNTGKSSPGLRRKHAKDTEKPTVPIKPNSLVDNQKVCSSPHVPIQSDFTSDFYQNLQKSVVEKEKNPVTAIKPIIKEQHILRNEQTEENQQPQCLSIINGSPGLSSPKEIHKSRNTNISSPKSIDTGQRKVKTLSRRAAVRKGSKHSNDFTDSQTTLSKHASDVNNAQTTDQCLSNYLLISADDFQEEPFYQETTYTESKSPSESIDNNEPVYETIESPPILRNDIQANQFNKTVLNSSKLDQYPDSPYEIVDYPQTGSLRSGIAFNTKSAKKCSSTSNTRHEKDTKYPENDVFKTPSFISYLDEGEYCLTESIGGHRPHHILYPDYDSVPDSGALSGHGDVGDTATHVCHDNRDTHSDHDNKYDSHGTYYDGRGYYTGNSENKYDNHGDNYGSTQVSLAAENEYLTLLPNEYFNVGDDGNSLLGHGDIGIATAHHYMDKHGDKNDSHAHLNVSHSCNNANDNHNSSHDNVNSKQDMPSMPTRNGYSSLTPNEYSNIDGTKVPKKTYTHLVKGATLDESIVDSDEGANVVDAVPYAVNDLTAGIKRKASLRTSNRSVRHGLILQNNEYEEFEHRG